MGGLSLSVDISSQAVHSVGNRMQPQAEVNVGSSLAPNGLTGSVVMLGSVCKNRLGILSLCLDSA